MKRFFGMMPRSEIKKEQTFLDPIGLKVTIQAGPNGYTILYSDGGSEYKDITASTEENFKEAYNIVIEHFGKLKPVNGESKLEEY